MGIEEVTSVAQFESVVKGATGKVVIVDYTATWCGPCKAIAPTFHQLADQYAKQAIFLKCDVDQNKELAQREGVTAMPTFKFYAKGVVVGEIRGADANQLKTKCAEICQKHSSSSTSIFSGKGFSLLGGSSSSSSSSSSSAVPSTTANRPNPWADPNFIPPGMRTSSAPSAPVEKPKAARVTAPVTPWTNPSFQPAPVPVSKAIEAAPITRDEDGDLARAIAMSLSNDTSSVVLSAGNDPALLVGINQDLLGQLIDMGFPKIRSEKALIITKSKSLDDATNWLVAHEDDVDVDEPLNIVGTGQSANTRGAPLGVVPGVVYEDDDGLTAAMRAVKAKAAAEKEAIRKAAAAASGLPETADMSQMTKEEKVAYIERLKVSRRAQKEMEERMASKKREADRREAAKAAGDTKRIREEQQNKMAADRVKREKEQDKERRKRIDDKIKADKEARLAAKKAREDAKAIPNAP